MRAAGSWASELLTKSPFTGRGFYKKPFTNPTDQHTPWETMLPAVKW